MMKRLQVILIFTILMSRITTSWSTLAMFSVYTWEKDCLHNNNKTLITLYVHYIFIYMYTVPACQNERVTCSFNLNQKIKKKVRQFNSFLRVSVPRSSLLSPYRFKPHRRSSFDPTDAMSLSSHCLAGWESSKPTVVPMPSSLDLRTSLHQSRTTLVSAYK